ncbi:MAG: hypothetical protein JNM43_28250 [Planctomycetaceae bacterium]|nr:hypothetical protein [Planctomycetaceae bacterium]
MAEFWVFVTCVQEGYGCFRSAKPKSVEWVGWEILPGIKDLQSSIRTLSRERSDSRVISRILSAPTGHLVASGVFYTDAWDRAGRMGLELIIVCRTEQRFEIAALSAACLELFQHGSLAFRLMRIAEIDDQSTEELANGILNEEIFARLWDGFERARDHWNAETIQSVGLPLSRIEIDLPAVQTQCFLTAALIASRVDEVTEVCEGVENGLRWIEAKPLSTGRVVRASQLVRNGNSVGRRRRASLKTGPNRRRTLLGRTWSILISPFTLLRLFFKCVRSRTSKAETAADGENS